MSRDAGHGAGKVGHISPDDVGVCSGGGQIDSRIEGVGAQVGHNGPLWRVGQEAAGHAEPGGNRSPGHRVFASEKTLLGGTSRFILPAPGRNNLLR